MQPNFMLERGMLTSVLIFEYDPIKKRKIIGNWSNFTGKADTDKEEPKVQKLIREGEVDFSTPFPNIALSGIYYIDGVEFDYTSEREEIVQTLYLVKKGNILNWDNRTSKPKFKDPDVTTN